MPRVFLSGASSGIGLAVARHLCGHKFEVWGTSRTLERLPMLPGFHSVQMDLASPESIAAGYAVASAEAGGFDVLINNAGDGILGPFGDLPLGEIRRQFETLLFGHLDLIQRALPGMRERRAGVIINVSSLAARLPIPFMAPYNAAKAALSAFTASLRLELAGTGIQVVDLQPGDFATGFNAALRCFHKPDDPAIRRVRERLHALEKGAPPPEIAAETIAALLARPVAQRTVGAFFQSHGAPLLARLLPAAALQRGLRAYFGLTPLR